jgi:hypothetical protein
LKVLWLLCGHQHTWEKNSCGCDCQFFHF